MLKFILGIVFGMAMSIGYVWFDLSLPRWMQLPETLRSNLVSTATETDLYALDGDAERRRRALEVYFAYRAARAAEIDADTGHPFLTALHAKRARHEAALLLAGDRGYDAMLAQPALRATLERRFATASPETLKERLLAEALEKKPFLKSWLSQRTEAPPQPMPLRDTLRALVAANPATHGQ